MRKIKIAQIGTSENSHGNHIFRALKNNTDIFEVVGYCMPENERAKFPGHMKDYEDYKELTLWEILRNPEIEAVTVETEEVYLSKYALLAAEHKKHIHMEKPGGVNLSDFEKLVETIKSNNSVFHTGYMYRYNPYIMELKEQIKNGDLGDIISVEAQMNCIHPPKVRQWLETFPGGMMFFLGCHLVDLIYSIQGTPKNIIPLNKCSGIDGVTGEDFGMAVFEYENGVSFAKVSAVEKGGFERRQLVVTGTKKTVELKPLEWFVEGGNMITDRYIRENDDWTQFTPKETCTPFDRYSPMMLSFAEMVRGEKQNPWGCDYELELYKTLLKACRK
ncbi:MAG: Gfo/Idh/MocA family oxidoreductase [Clostridia bacterium]|nr:Gfo/Idh/MocA family oxidoreductase [Clostridia bacterium]